MPGPDCCALLRGVQGRASGVLLQLSKYKDIKKEFPLKVCGLLSDDPAGDLRAR